ncbi:MAG: YbaB/EbfC family nucleoid-associated protein [Acidobacteriaceae bacterium]
MNPLDMQQVLGQAKQMQEQLQQNMSQTLVEASAGGGVVTVKMNGQKQVLGLKIDPAAIAGLGANAADVEMLEDLVTAAFNEASRRVDDSMKSDRSGMLGGLNLPGF